MLYAGLDLSRQRLDVHVLDEEGRTVEVMGRHTPTRTLCATSATSMLQGVLLCIRRRLRGLRAPS